MSCVLQDGGPCKRIYLISINFEESLNSNDKQVY